MASSSPPPPPPPPPCAWNAAISPSRLRSDLYNLETDDDDDDAAGGRKVPLVVPVLASLLERTIARNERASGERVRAAPEASEDGAGGSLAAFSSRRVLDMTIQSFLGRFFRYARVTPAVYVVAYVYMDRLRQLNPRVRVRSTNVQRLLVTAIMVASKFVEDMNYSNSYFAEVGGLGARELNSLELKFLFMMRFKLHVNPSVYESYCSHLEREVSFGGGYQIERSLRRPVCAEASPAEGLEKGIERPDGPRPVGLQGDARQLLFRTAKI